MYKCPKCPKKYTHKTSLHRHKKYECNSKRQFPCPQCDKSFNQRGTLYKHQVSIHQTFPTKLGRKFPKKKVYEENIIIVGDKYSCKRCSRTYSHPTSMRKHIKEYCPYLKEFKCSDCDAIFSSRASLMDHRVNVHYVKQDEQQNKNVKESNEDYENEIKIEEEEVLH
ncbi:zinc finger protein 92-like [Sitophilus oryzae]|uniref:Zinc finger protein 92-like n=1 Tax=Sitophilus oryzae TaxID=7048 RepID=A0A6J2YRF7_SITOR|nr:zinc finger protein 92-like [Sitophilus oryzae]